MRKILFVALAAFIFAACSGGGDEDIIDGNETELGEGGEDDGGGEGGGGRVAELIVRTGNQTIYADEVSAQQDIIFSAPAEWTTSVTLPTRTSGVEWLKLTSGGEEKYSGEAGDFSLTVELKPNDTGADRSATVTITSGEESETLTIMQNSATVAEAAEQQGSDLVTLVPAAGTRLVEKITDTGAYGGTIEFTYDTENRIKSINFYGVDVLNFVYFKNHIFVERPNSGEEYTLQLDREGQAICLTKSDWAGRSRYGLTRDGNSSKVDFPAEDGMYAWAKFTSGNGGSITGYQRSGGMTGIFSSDHSSSYTFHAEQWNRANIDLNALLAMSYDFDAFEIVEKLLIIFRAFGGNSKHLIAETSTVEDGGPAVKRTWSYAGNGGLAETATWDDGYDSGVYTIGYRDN